MKALGGIARVDRPLREYLRRFGEFPVGTNAEVTKALTGLPLPSFDANLPVRFGFLGGLAKHKGAHVLLEAFRDVRGAELDVFGDSTDRPYVERVRALCAEVGARWHGSFDKRELRTILARLDVVCVPSLWDENAPFVIREAFAAGRPVIASRTEALVESVRV